MKRFENKVVIITGGGSGIGQASAISFAREGAKVVVADISQLAGEQTVEGIIADEGTAFFCPVNVGSSESVNNVVTTTIERFGQLDIFFANAGIGGPESLCANMTDEQWTELININLSGCFFGARAALPHLAKTKGNIVMTGSVAGIRGGVANVGYHSSKHGVAGLVKAIACEYAKDTVRVNGVLPGGIHTSMTAAGKTDPDVDHFICSVTPLGRWGKPEEIASAVLFLASDDASFITGELLSVDGGWTAK